MPACAADPLSFSFRLAEPTLEDAALVVSWRNDPITLAMSYHGTPLALETFFPRYCAEFFIDKNHLPHFACVNKKPVAFLTSRPYEEPFAQKACAIGINVDPNVRGQGFGTRALSLFAHTLVTAGFCIVAEIKEENKASIKAFEKAGFCLYDSYEKYIPDLNSTFRIVRYLLQ